MPRFAGRVRFRFNDNLVLDDIVRELERLPHDNLVLLLSYANDKTGQPFDIADVTKLFSQHSPVPVYGHAEIRLGHGIVGGKLLNPTAVAAEAAMLIQRILRGEDIGKIPVGTKSTSQYMFDYQQMERFHIPLSSLPPDSIVLNRPVSFYAAHKDVILTASAIIVFLSIVILLLIVNIVQRRRSARALRESEAKYIDLYENAPDMYYSVDIKTAAIKECNETFIRTTGFSREEILGRPIFDLYYSDSVEDAKKRLQQFSATGEVRNVERRVKCKDGRLIDISLNVSAIRNKEGKIIYSRSIWHDITERKRMEEERLKLEERLHRAEKMQALGTLAGGVAHDLNNVLGVLFGYSQLLLDKIPEESPLRTYASNILKSSEKAAAIVQDLLTLARRGVASPEVINLNEVISEFYSSPVFDRLKAYHPNVTFRTELDKDLLHIKGSPIHLEKTVMNLISNAAEAISDRGEVTIRTENRYLDKTVRDYDEIKEGDYVVLTISDTGRGIAAADMGKIFEPFYTKKVMGRSGTGLGLAVVWGTVKDHNGYINVRSEEANGSTFTLYFPVTREALTRGKQKIPIEQYMGRGEAILAVDDVPEQREVVTSILTRLGYQVHTVSSGEEAVTYLRTHKADLLLLDMVMDPGINGMETYKRVLEINRKQKAIIMSGFSETDLVKKSLELGAGTFVSKPYLMEKIGLAIRAELMKVTS